MRTVVRRITHTSTCDACGKVESIVTASDRASLPDGWVARRWTVDEDAPLACSRECYGELARQEYDEYIASRQVVA